MDKNVDTYFPSVDSGIVPLEGQVVLQVIYVPEVSYGGIVLASQAQENKQFSVKVSKVVAVGPSAFCNKLTGKPWAGVEVSVGDFVVAPQVSGTRFTKKLTQERDAPEIHFVACKDTEIQFKVTDPLSFNSVY
jgi:co-chaperonin GroES (HSP10)